MSKLENRDAFPEQQVETESSLVRLWQTVLQKIGRENIQNPEPSVSVILFGKERHRLPRGTRRIINHVEKRLADPHRYYEDDLIKRNIEELVYATKSYSSDLQKGKIDLDVLYSRFLYEGGRHWFYRKERMPERDARRILPIFLEMLYQKKVPLMSGEIAQRQFHFTTTEDKEGFNVDECVVIPATEATPSLTVKAQRYFAYSNEKWVELWLEIGDTLNHDFGKRKQVEEEARAAAKQAEQQYKFQSFVDTFTDSGLAESVFFEIGSRWVSLTQTEFKRTEDIDHLLTRASVEEDDDNDISAFIQKLLVAVPTLEVDSEKKRSEGRKILARLRDKDSRFTLVFRTSEYVRRGANSPDIEVILYLPINSFKEKTQEAREWFKEQFPFMLDEVRKQKVESGSVDVEEELEQVMASFIHNQEWGRHQKNVYLQWGGEFLEGKIKELLEKSL